MKLELKHISPYFPYGLKVKDNVSNTCSITKLCTDVNQYIEIEDEFGYNRLYNFDYIKPILIPVFFMEQEKAEELMRIVVYDDVIDCVDIEANALENKIEITSSMPYGEYKVIVDSYNSNIEAHYEYYGGQIESLPVTYQAFQFIFKNHFDIFGLIEAGLAVRKY